MREYLIVCERVYMREYVSEYVTQHVTEYTIFAVSPQFSLFAHLISGKI